MEDSAEAILRQCEERKTKDFNIESTGDAEKREGAAMLRHDEWR
jgi:hypothetical protein